jgi:hypothetical protein
MAKPKILILTGDAAESLEVMYPYQRLLEEGYEVHIAAPAKKKLRFVVHDFEAGFDTYTEKPGYTWDADLAFKDVNPADYAAWSSRAEERPNIFATTKTFAGLSDISSIKKSRSHNFATRRSRL